MLTSFLKTDLVKIVLLGCVAFVIASYLIASGIRETGQNTAISVTGSAEEMVVSDAGKWTFSITKYAEPQAVTYSSQALRLETQIVTKYLIAQGLEDNSITIQPLVTNVVCQSQSQVMYDANGRQQCAGPYTYSLVQTIIVESDDVALIKKLSLNASTELSSKNVSIQTVSVDYFYNNLSELRVRLLEEASKNAKERAQAIAKSTGGSIGNIRSASQGVFQVTQRNSTDVSDYGSYDTSTIEKKVTAIVRASFEVR